MQHVCSTLRNDPNGKTLGRTKSPSLSFRNMVTQRLFIAPPPFPTTSPRFHISSFSPKVLGTDTPQLLGLSHHQVTDTCDQRHKLTDLKTIQEKP